MKYNYRKIILIFRYATRVNLMQQPPTRFSFNPRLTKLVFVTRLTEGGRFNPLDFPNRTPMKLILVSIGRYGPSLSIHTKISTIEVVMTS